MGQLQSAPAQRLATVLSKYRLDDGLAAVAGLLVVPKFQANCYRLELLAHLIVASCRGTQRVTSTHIGHWLNRQLGDRSIAGLEDPLEDVFVLDVITAAGSFLALGGMWEAADTSTSMLIQAVERYETAKREAWLESSLALLAVSDFVLRRADLQRWQLEESIPARSITFSPRDPWSEWATRATLSVDDLTALGTSTEQLAPFIFNLEASDALLLQSNQESEFHARPLVKVGDTLILAMATSVTYAVKRHLARVIASKGAGDEVQALLMSEVMSRGVEMLRAGGGSRVENVPLAKETSNCDGIAKSLLFSVGQRRFVHLLFLSESLEQFANQGLLTPSEYDASDEQRLLEHVSGVRKALEALRELDFAHTIGIFGHLGQAKLLSEPEQRPKWTFDLIRLDDLSLLMKERDRPLQKLIHLLAQREEALSQGLEFLNTNGLLNFYAYWVREDYCLASPEMSRGQHNVISLANNYLISLRERSRVANDEHCEPSLGGYEWVYRASPNSLYPSLRRLPVYVAPNRLAHGFLSFCVVVRGTAVWINALPPPDDDGPQRLIVELWKELESLIFKFLVSADLKFSFPAVEVTLDFRSVVSMQAVKDVSTLPDAIKVQRHKRLPAAKVLFDPGMMKLFLGVDNNGERSVLAYIFAALRQISGNEDLDYSQCDADALSVLGGPDGRLLHVFQNSDPIEYLLAKHAVPTFDRPVEHVGTSLRTAFSWHPATGDSKLALSPKESCEALNQAVSKLVARIATRLKRFDRASMVERLIFAHETLIRDKQQWRSTARAVRALYGAEEGTAAAEANERERAEGGITIRALIEAAVCECSSTEGIAADDYSVDQLYGDMTALIRMGRDSETIYHGLSKSGITIHPSGAYSFKAELLDDAGGAYVKAAFSSGYVSAAEDYEKWVTPGERDGEASNKAEFGSAAFRKAFRAEYGLELPALLEIVGLLMDECLKRDCVTLTVTEAEVKALRRDRPFSDGDLAAFLASFSLFARDSWAPKPPYRAKDVEPWRFERRLSVMLRPLIACLRPDSVAYSFGVGTLRHVLAYVLDSTMEGKFEPDVYLSKEMRAYLGARVEAQGHAFTVEVAELLSEIGWKVELEVKMSRLGAGKSPNLGDIDVVAWKPDGQVLAIECKRLKNARTVAEIAHTCARFAGNQGDHLFKHLRRVAWLKENPEKLAQFIGLDVGKIRLHAPLVTSAGVPFQYLQSLPIRASEIVPIQNLKDYQSRV